MGAVLRLPRTNRAISSIVIPSLRACSSIARSSKIAALVGAIGRRLIETDRAHTAQIEPGDGPADIVIDDPPQPLVGNSDEARCRQHRHLAHQHQCRLAQVPTGW